MELGPEERRALAAFAEVYTPSEADARAALLRVRARIDGGAAIEDVEPERTRSRAAWWIAAGTVVLAIAAAIVIAMRLDLASKLALEQHTDDPEAALAQVEESTTVAEAIHREDRAEKRRPPEAASELEVAAEAAPDPVVESEPDVEREPAVAPEPDRVGTASGKRARTRSGDRTADATLHAEMALLRPAQQALRSGNHRRALELYDDHARSFPGSALAEERALGRVEALCGLGRRSEARAAAAKFAERFPGSPYRAKAMRTCAEEDAG